MQIYYSSFEKNLCLVFRKSWQDSEDRSINSGNRGERSETSAYSGWHTWLCRCNQQWRQVRGHARSQCHEVHAKLQKSHCPLSQSRTVYISCLIFISVERTMTQIKNANNFSFKNVIKYIDDQFERYLQDESGLNRRHIMDNRVHCCFYFINPAGHG